MYLDEKNFKMQLLETPGCSSQEEELERLIGVAPEGERSALRENLKLDQQIMQARTYGDVKDISLESILACISSYDIFYKLYEGMKAGVYFSRFQGVRTVRTHRGRRVL